MAKTQYYGTGRRKSSVARVRLIPGNGNITVNKKPLDDYLAQEIVKREVKRPFEIAGCEGTVSYTHLDVYKRQILHR